MDWKNVTSQNDIDEIMKKFYNFHDSCVIEFFCKTGMYVDERKYMRQDEESEIKMILKSQLGGTIEIHFERIKQMNIHIYDKSKYFNNIDGAKMYMNNNLIFWADSMEWNETNIDNEITYIICEKIKYIIY